jgi:hypothetical protein
MQVEQHISRLSGKSFVMLLHYPPSKSLQGQCYPALFLGGWDHIFLDSVGDSSTIDVDTYISHACLSTVASSSERAKCVLHLQSILHQRVLSQLVGQNIFYCDQNMFQRDSFKDRKISLARLFSTTIDTSTVGKILCEKFADLWFDHFMFRATCRASQSLIHGVTQLSLTTLIHSTLIHVFQAFLSDILVRANQWKNFDLIALSIRTTPTNKCLLILFEKVLRELPVLPLEELVLQRRRIAVNRLLPLPTNRVHSEDNQFPFFQLFSSYLDELVDSVVTNIVQDHFNSYVELGIYELSTSETLQKVMETLNSETEKNCERKKLVTYVISYIADHVQSPKSNDGPDCLFKCYLRQYVEWKIGCTANSTFVEWWMIRLNDLRDFGENNIVAIHVIGRLEQSDMMKVASIISLTEPFFQELKSECDETNLNGCDLCEILFRSVESALIKKQFSVSKIRWSVLLSTASNSTLSSATRIKDEKLAMRLRRLGLVYTDGRLNGDSSALERFVAEPNNFSMQRYLDSAVASNGQIEETTEVLLEFFFSPLWLQTTRFFLPGDVDFLLDVISRGDISRSKAVGLLRSAIVSGRNAAENLVFGCSMKMLLQINKWIAADTITQFTEKGDRRCLQHFIPEWLRCEADDGGSARPSSTVQMRFSEYQNSIYGELANVVFDLFLTIFVAEAISFTSEHLFLLLERELDSEVTLNRQMYTQLARLRNSDKGESLQGTHISSIAISARLVCFVAKIAFEVATDMNSPLLNGLYANDAIIFIDELMELDNAATWQDFFMSTILRLRGEGTLAKALLDGPLASMTWCKTWTQGIPATKEDVNEALHQAESSLAKATTEEQWKVVNMRCCPHCNQTFMVSALNCGSFICGRDFHGENGQIYLDGIAVSGTQGCGQAFNINQSQEYQVDQALLATFQARIDEERAKVERCQESAVLWDRAQAMEIPHVIKVVRNMHGDKMMMPFDELLTQIDDDDNTPQLVRVLWESAALAPFLSLLPGMIEVCLC